MPRDNLKASDQGALGTRMLQEVLSEFQISEFSEAQLAAFIDSVSERSKPQFCKFFQMKYDLTQIKEELSSLKDDVNVAIASSAIGLGIAAPQLATLLQLAPQQAKAPGQVVGTTAYSPPVQNADGTISRKMNQVGNNVIVTFSRGDEMASKKSKLFGSSARMDSFTSYNMNQFPEWVAQFLSGVNLFQPTEPNARRVALLLRVKAAKMANNIPQQVSMTNLQELIAGLDKLFNTTGNRIVAVNIFNSYSQREDVSLQDYSIGIEHLFYRAYPGVDPNKSIFLMDHFITGLVPPQVKKKLRIPPQPGNFRGAANSAMAYTAVMFLEHQTLKQRSLAWKLATSSSHPLLTKSIHNAPKGSIQMVDTTPVGDASIQALRQWCALHKFDKLSDSDCRAQQDTATNSAKAKKQIIGAKKDSKPRRLKFKSNNDKKKFLRSIEEAERVSLDSVSSDDETIVEQSFMQLNPGPSNEGSDDEEGDHVDLHILVLQPNPPFEEVDVVMEEEDLSSALAESFHPFKSNISTNKLSSAISHLHLEGLVSCGRKNRLRFTQSF